MRWVISTRRINTILTVAVTVALLVSGCGLAKHGTGTAAGSPVAGVPAAAGTWSEHATASGVAARVAGHGWTVALGAPGPAGSTLTLADPGRHPQLPAARAALGALATTVDVAAEDPVAIELTGGALPAAGATLTRTLATVVPTDTRATLAYYDPGHDAWTAVPSTLAADRRTLSAAVSHFSLWDVLTYGAGWLLDTRIGAPSCPGAGPAWAQGVTFLDDMNAPLRWCVGADAKDLSVLVVKVAVNRGYGVVVTPNAATARVSDSIFNGSSDDVLVRIMAGVLLLPGDYAKGRLLVPGGATAELAFTEAAVRAAGGQPLIKVNADPEYMVAGETYTAITKALGPAAGPAAVIAALLAVAQCATSFGHALVVGDAPAAAAAGLKCLAGNADDIGRNLASILVKAFPTTAAGDLGKLAGQVGGRLWQLWAAGVVFGLATWFADRSLDAAAWTLNVFPKRLPLPSSSSSSEIIHPTSFARYAGSWSGHVRGLKIDASGRGEVTYRTYNRCPGSTGYDPQFYKPGVPCDPTSGSVMFQIDKVMSADGNIVHAIIQSTNDPSNWDSDMSITWLHNAGPDVATVQINPSKKFTDAITFCDEAAGMKGVCGA